MGTDWVAELENKTPTGKRGYGAQLTRQFRRLLGEQQLLDACSILVY
jgi:hypothetical protein